MKLMTRDVHLIQLSIHANRRD